MNFFELFLYILQGDMKTPSAFGWFHILCLSIVAIFIIILYKRKKYFGERQLKTVLGIYGVISLILEILKQLIWAFNYDPLTNIVTWNYEWYSFPFQLCTTPMIASLICLFLQKGTLRDSLLSYIAFTTILGSIATIFLPESCFVSDILVNIHAMWLHLGSFVVSVYLLMSGAVKADIQNLKRAFIVFLIFVGIALLLNVTIYNANVLNGETFNMFYISPYFISDLPVFDIIQKTVSYPQFLIIYIIAILLGTSIIYSLAKAIEHIFKRSKLAR